MSKRKIEPLDFNGETIYIEVLEIDKEPASGKDGFEKVSTKKDAVNAGEKVRSTISALAGTLQKAFEKAPPDQWTLEVNMGFKASGGIPFITEGEASGAVKVSATWKRAQDGAGK